MSDATRKQPPVSLTMMHGNPLPRSRFLHSALPAFNKESEDEVLATSGSAALGRKRRRSAAVVLGLGLF